MKEIVIVGAGGLAKEVAFLIDQINHQKKQWNILGFIDSNKNNIGKKNGKYSVISFDDWLIKCPNVLHVVFGVGDPKFIKRLRSKLKKNENLCFPNLIHPNAIGDWENINMGIGNIISAATVFTTDITVGSFNLFNLSCTVGHDCIIGDCNVINPTVNISGSVVLENEILLGTGSQILQSKHICSGCIVGAGAVVSKSIEEKGVYVGVPARKIT